MKMSDKIIMLRKKNGFSQEKLAEKLNVSRQAVSRWESGTALPDAVNILSLSKLFKVSADYLLNDDYDSDNHNSKPIHILNITGVSIFLLGAISILIMGILASVNPCIATIDDVTKTGLRGFLAFHNLEWLFGICIIFIFVGIFIAFYPKSFEYAEILIKS